MSLPRAETMSFSSLCLSLPVLGVTSRKNRRLIPASQRQVKENQFYYVKEYSVHTWSFSFFTFVRDYSEKAMASHSSTLAWKIPWTEEPGRLQSIGSWRVGHDWVTSLSLFTFMHWRRKWQPTPVFLPGESQGRGSLVGCHLWGGTESDMTEAT